MQSHRPTTLNQSGFSVIEVLLVVLVVAVLAVSGFLVYQRHKSSSTQSTVIMGTAHTTEQPKHTSTTQLAQTASQNIRIRDRTDRA